MTMRTEQITLRSDVTGENYLKFEEGILLASFEKYMQSIYPLPVKLSRSTNLGI